MTATNDQDCSIVIFVTSIKVWAINQAVTLIMQSSNNFLFSFFIPFFMLCYSFEGQVYTKLIVGNNKLIGGGSIGWTNIIQ